MLLLNENARAAAFYFGEGPAIDATSAIPLALDRSVGRDLSLHGRGDAVRQLRAARGDVILIGRPGTGKTRLAMEADGVRFVRRDADANAVAESLRRTEPMRLVIDDAGLALDRIEMILELRREGYAFSVIATTWPEDAPRVRRYLPDAAEIALPLLERSVVDALVQSLGVTNPFLRREILDQAEGRIGWAVTLTDLARRGGGLEVLSGRAIVGEVEGYLERMGAASTEALGLISVIGALGGIDPLAELRDVEEWLGISRPGGLRALQDVAAAGVLGPRGDRLRVAPERFSQALVTHTFYERDVTPWPMADLLTRWPDHRDAIMSAILQSAADGSGAARDHLDRLLGSVGDLPHGMVERFVVLDERAAERAIEESTRLPEVARHREAILAAATRRFALPAAVRGLLELALTDGRPERQHPDHPIRVLGEVGSRIDPLGSTSFEARSRILAVTNAWLDADHASERQLVWARVVAHLLDPTVEGNFTDPGSPTTVHLSGAFESPIRLKVMVEELWPEVAERVDGLDTEALVALVELVDAWGRLARRFPGTFGAVPTEEQAAVARVTLERMVPVLRDAAVGRPAAQTALRDTARLLGLSVRQDIDPEFRILTWQPWRRIHKDPAGRFARIVGRLADCWVEEEPAALMARLKRHSEEAARRDRDLHPMIFVAFTALCERVPDIEPYLVAGLESGLSWQLRPLVAASIERASGLPAWFEAALSGDARATTLECALLVDGDPLVTERALAELRPSDVPIVERVLITRGRDGHGEISRSLLIHPIAEVRGVACLWFGIGDDSQLPAIPDQWYSDWADAFISAPLVSIRGIDNYRLGTLVPYLVEHDPDTVERWIICQLDSSPTVPLYRLPDRAAASLSRLPADHRHRLVRASTNHTAQADLLRWFIDGDLTWLTALLDDGIVEPADIVTALGHDDGDIATRVRRILSLAPVLVPRGILPVTLAGTAMFGTWSGEESGQFESIRVAFVEAPPSDDTLVEQVRSAGVGIFERMRDKALRDEQDRRVTGDL